MILSKHMNPLRWALLSVAFLIAGLLWWGIAWLDVPPIYKLTHNTMLPYRGYTIIALAVSLAIFHRWAASKILWLGEKLHRWISALMMMGMVIIDGSMHLLSIPHMEGWWLPIFGGSVFITGVSAWLHQWRCKLSDTQNDNS